MAAPHVLIVNDDADGLFLLGMAVAKEWAGATISKCHSPSEALSILATQKVDAMITDNGMPGMSGIALTRQIRREGCSIPVLMVTGAEQVRTAALEAGVNSFTSS